MIESYTQKKQGITFFKDSISCFQNNDPMASLLQGTCISYAEHMVGPNWRNKDQKIKTSKNWSLLLFTND